MKGKKQTPEMFYKKGVLNSQNSLENTCARLSLLIKVFNKPFY